MTIMIFLGNLNCRLADIFKTTINKIISLLNIFFELLIELIWEFI